MAKPDALGFDPTVVPVRALDGTVQHDITVGPQQETYRTLDMLWGTDTKRVVGHGTRVWKVRKVESTSGELVGAAVVLKDAWVDKHREREGTINARIRASAGALSSDDQARLSKVLLTVECHGDVSIAGQPDCTRPWVEPPLPYERENCAKRVARARPRAPVVEQCHYRIVFSELCRPLREETSLSTVFDALEEAAEGRRTFYTHAISLTL